MSKVPLCRIHWLSENPPERWIACEPLKLVSTTAATRWSSWVSLVRIFEHYVPTFAPHKALKLIT